MVYLGGKSETVKLMRYLNLGLGSLASGLGLFNASRSVKLKGLRPKDKDLRPKA
jgi:hypothetical protein